MTGLKYASALQAAAEHARGRASPEHDLTAECRAAGIDGSQIAQLVRGAQAAADGRITAPNLAELGKGILADLGAMIAAVKTGTPLEGNAAVNRVAALNIQARLASLNDIQIAKLTGISQANGDSLHRLVMDLHKTLNRLAAGFAQETVAGARAYGLAPDDRPAVEAGKSSHRERA